jgi:diguanylate cyclase (GGDEF)-like protein/PAS domain S-box-containing protein
MSLNAALNLFLEVYQIAINQPSIGNAVAEFVRREVPIAVARVIGQNDRYIVHGSPGHGNWARIPWVAVYDRSIAETAQDDFYIVYLVQEDYSGVYLSLNQDVPIIRRVYGSEAKGMLAARAWDCIARLGQIHEPSIIGPIDLKVTSASSLGPFFEQGSICAKHYKRGEIPNDEILGKDLKDLLNLRLLLTTKYVVTTLANRGENDAEPNIKDHTNLADHEHIERNRKLSERLERIHGAGVGIFGVDGAGRVTFINPAALRMLGFTREEILGQSAHSLIHHSRADGSDYRVEDSPMYSSYTKATESSVTEEVLWRKEGSCFPVEYYSTPIIRDGEVMGAVVTFNDITERKQLEEEIQRMAYHDSLTGLPNRNLFSDRLSIALAQARRNQKTVGVAMLDLDRFKDVNDTLGHDAGDLLLKAATERLNAALRKGDTIARFGGDEFVLILPDLKATEDAIQIAQKIVDGFCKPFLIDTNQLTVTTSIGITVYPHDGIDEGILLKNADIAMYQAKQAGRARYQLYEKT